MQPETAAPRAEVSARGAGKRVIALKSETKGASIGYRRADRDDPGWLVYADPLVIDPGQTLEAKAIRYGYAESPVIRVISGKR